MVRSGDADEDGYRARAGPAAPDEVVVTKNRVSAFVASPLEATLRSSRISDVVLAGLATFGRRASTLRHAADLDFAISRALGRVRSTATPRSTASSREGLPAPGRRA